MPKNNIVLLWASSYAFASHMSKLLTQSSLSWSIFSALDELNGNQAQHWLALLMDGNSQGIEDALIKLRAKTGCAKLPVILSGGDPCEALKTDPYLRQIALPNDIKELEACLLHDSPLSLPTTPPPSPSANRRSSYRHACNQPCIMEMPITIIDISEDGAQLECPFSLPNGATFNLSLASLNPEFRKMVTFKVQRTRPCLPPNKAFRLHGIFEGLNPEMRILMRRTMLRVQVARTQKLEIISRT